jgi:hypothetical protein
MVEQQPLFCRSIIESYSSKARRSESYIIPKPQSLEILDDPESILRLPINTIIPEIHIGVTGNSDCAYHNVVIAFANPTLGGRAAVSYENEQNYLLPGETIKYPVDNNWITLIVIKGKFCQILQIKGGNFSDSDCFYG